MGDDCLQGDGIWENRRNGRDRIGGERTSGNWPDALNQSLFTEIGIAGVDPGFELNIAAGNTAYLRLHHAGRAKTVGGEFNRQLA